VAGINFAFNIGGTTHQSNVAISPEQLQQLAQAAASGSAVRTAKIEELATKLGATQAALLAIFRALGHDNIPVERLPDAFGSAVMQILTMREALSRPSNEGSEIGDLNKQALAALDDGRFDEATRLLNAIRTLERKASERLRRAADESRADWLAGLQSEAETCALLARAALAQRDVTGAFDRFEEGLGVLAPAEPERRWSYAIAAAKALFELGSSAGLNDALAAAIRLYKHALAAGPRERVPLDWATTQNNLGTALQALGERESSTAKLEQAVEAYRASLQEWTTEATPNWHEIARRNFARTLALLEQRQKQ
jgi:tetratricopeptide (TPR) repeat protein